MRPLWLQTLVMKVIFFNDCDHLKYFLVNIISGSLSKTWWVWELTTVPRNSGKRIAAKEPYRILSIEETCLEVTLYTRIWKLLDLNIGLDTGYPDWHFMWYLFFQTNSGIVLWLCHNYFFPYTSQFTSSNHLMLYNIDPDSVIK